MDKSCSFSRDKLCILVRAEPYFIQYVENVLSTVKNFNLKLKVTYFQKWMPFLWNLNDYEYFIIISLLFFIINFFYKIYKNKLTKGWIDDVWDLAFSRVSRPSESDVPNTGLTINLNELITYYHQTWILIIVQIFKGILLKG